MLASHTSGGEFMRRTVLMLNIVHVWASETVVLTGGNGRCFKIPLPIPLPAWRQVSREGKLDVTAIIWAKLKWPAGGSGAWAVAHVLVFVGLGQRCPAATFEMRSSE